jgi:hypothetical protein
MAVELVVIRYQWIQILQRVVQLWVLLLKLDELLLQQIVFGLLKGQIAPCKATNLAFQELAGLERRRQVQRVLGAAGVAAPLGLVCREPGRRYHAHVTLPDVR